MIKPSFKAVAILALVNSVNIFAMYRLSSARPATNYTYQMRPTRQYASKETSTKQLDLVTPEKLHHETFFNPNHPCVKKINEKLGDTPSKISANVKKHKTALAYVVAGTTYFKSLTVLKGAHIISYNTCENLTGFGAVAVVGALGYGVYRFVEKMDDLETQERSKNKLQEKLATERNAKQMLISYADVSPEIANEIVNSYTKESSPTARKIILDRVIAKNNLQKQAVSIQGILTDHKEL